jgi:hypothetical protein
VSRRHFVQLHGIGPRERGGTNRTLRIRLVHVTAMMMALEMVASSP